MAHASLLSLTQTIDQILHSQSRDRSRLFLDEEQLQLRSLHERLSNLLLFLENSETASAVEEKIRDAAYEAEDLVESHMARTAVRFQGITSCFCEIIAVLQHCAGCFLSTTTTQTFEESLQIVIEKLSSICQEVEKMKANNDGDEALHPVESNATVEMEGVEAVKVHPRISLGASTSEPTSSDNSSMVGFKNDMLQINDMLTGSSTQLEIISLIGMGGIGKTTLATNIYNDLFVKRHIDIRAWITVSQEYDVVALLAGLLRSIRGAIIQVNEKDEAKLKLKLNQSLKQRKYLIVMDDVWDDVVFY